MTIPPTDRTSYYLDRAAECDSMAASARSSEIREIMLGLARRWRALAGPAEVKRKSRVSQAEQHPSTD
jgi:hypothetical protein